MARNANVTPATVSNVIRKKGIVSAATQERVLASIHELGYRPNLLARSLVQGKSLTLALLIPNIANPFYPQIALEVEQLARSHGYQLILCNTHSDPAIGSDYLERFSGGWIDGVLALSGGIELADLQDLASRGIPVVRCLFTEELEKRGQLSALPSVDFDFEAAAGLVARHLAELGHRRFTAIVERKTDGVADHLSRLRGFQSALHAAGLTLAEADVLYGDSSLESGLRAAHDLLRRPEPPTAILASNDLMALGAIEAVFQAGLDVPGDVSVVGIDDISLSAHVRPALTTAAFPTRQLAEHIMDSLLRQIGTPDAVPEHVVLRPHLMVRQSTAAPCQDG